MSRINLVTDSILGRSTSVNEAVAEPMPTVAAPDAETFASLYERTFPRVYAYVCSLVRDRATAEDVTALAFERAYRKRRRYHSARLPRGLVVRHRPQRRARRAAAPEE